MGGDRCDGFRQPCGMAVLECVRHIRSCLSGGFSTTIQNPGSSIKNTCNRREGLLVDIQKTGAGSTKVTLIFVLIYMLKLRDCLT